MSCADGAPDRISPDVDTGSGIETSRFTQCPAALSAPNGGAESFDAKLGGFHWNLFTVR
jgi:hypothetical protein